MNNEKLCNVYLSWEYFVGSIEATLSVNCTKNQLRNKTQWTWSKIYRRYIVVREATPVAQVDILMLLNICPPQVKPPQNHNLPAAHWDPSYSILGEQYQLLNINTTSNKCCNWEKKLEAWYWLKFKSSPHYTLSYWLKFKRI